MPSFIQGQSKHFLGHSKLGIQAGALPALTVAALLSMAVMPTYGQAEATAPVTGEVSISTQPFVGEVNADRVYVRSGPGTSFYEIGQLGKGDIVNVVGQRQGWYRISPPTGTFCYLAKELVELGADGKVGTVKAEFANVRAASSLSPNSDYAVLTVIRRGTAVNILGSTERYYRITPPEKAFMYVAPQFVRPVTGKEYTPPVIKAPALEGAPVSTGAVVPPPPPPAVKPVPATEPSAAPVTAEPNLVPAPTPKVIQETTVPAVVPGNENLTPVPAPKAEPKAAAPVAVPLPSEKINREPVVVVTTPDAEKPSTTTVVEEVPNPVPPVATPAPAPAPAPVPPVAAKPVEKKPKVVVVAPEPSVPLNRDAYATFNDLNKRTQEELNKPLMERQLGGLLAEYRTLLAQPNLPGSVKTVTEARIGVIERIQKVQDLARENGDSSTAALNAQRQALQQQWSDTEKKIEEYERTGPYLAEGKLQTSTALKDKYVLVNPSTGRVVAYVDPSAPVDLAPLMGQYIGLRGIYEQAEGLDIKVIKVRNATILPAPAAPASR